MKKKETRTYTPKIVAGVFGIQPVTLRDYHSRGLETSAEKTRKPSAKRSYDFHDVVCIGVLLTLIRDYKFPPDQAVLIVNHTGKDFGAHKYWIRVALPGPVWQGSNQENVVKEWGPTGKKWIIAVHEIAEEVRQKIREYFELEPKK